MKQNVPACLLALICCSFVANTASAKITNLSFSGPGFSGAGGIAREGLIFGTGDFLTEPQLVYTNVDYIEIQITVDSSGTYDINEAPTSGYVQNITGQTWSSLVLTNNSPSLGGFDTWTDYNDTVPFWGSAVSTSNSVTFSRAGGTGLPSGSTSAIYGDFVATGPGTIDIFETPTAVPEPSSLALIVIALSCIALGRSRRPREV